MLGDVDYELTEAEINRRYRWERHFEEYIERMTDECEKYNRSQRQLNNDKGVNDKYD